MLAVNAAEVATPLASVSAVLTPPANVPLGPVCAGAVNVTFTPLTGLPPASLTVACNSDAKAMLITALCGVPPVGLIVDGGPGVLVSWKFAGVAPVTEAVTV